MRDSEKPQILGIGRAPKFSPNCVDRDAAILQAVAEVLRSRDYVVHICSEEALPDWQGYVAAFSMARHPQALGELARWEAEGFPVINSARSLQACDRADLTARCIAAGVPMPPFRLLCADEPDGALAQLDGMYFPLWLKRCEACAQHEDDVCHAADAAEAHAALVRFHRRGISRVMACPHQVGDLVKFYGVLDTGFFYHYYPIVEGSTGKFGLERHNGRPLGFQVQTEKLHAAAERAARVTGLSVYGGDAIISADGSFQIIDFNDWPSFSRCRAEAAVAIADCLCAAVRGRRSPMCPHDTAHASAGQDVLSGI